MQLVSVMAQEVATPVFAGKRAIKFESEVEQLVPTKQLRETIFSNLKQPLKDFKNISP